MLKIKMMLITVLAALSVSCNQTVDKNKTLLLTNSQYSYIKDFPFDESLRHSRGFSPGGQITDLGDGIFLIEDCVNVYAVVRDSAALLIDFGSGMVLDRLDEIGAKKVESVLMTHHHRDGAQGLVDIGQYQFKLIVPEAEKKYFSEAENFWDEVPLYINYDCRSYRNTIRRNVRVDGTLADGESYRWHGLEFNAIQTPGVTEGSNSYLVDIDGKTCAFTGDLIAGEGKVSNWFDLHWAYYGFTQGIDASDKSFDHLRKYKPSEFFPAHGTSVDNPEKAMQANSAVYAKLRKMLLPNELHRTMNHARRILPHLVYLNANTYAIISKSGKAILWDYGYVNRDEIEKLFEEYGVTRIDAVTFSHYHDDHNIRAYELLHHTRPEIWIHESMADVFEHPEKYNLPCLVPFPIKADRIIGMNETIQWEEYTLNFFHMPGQTEYHAGLETEIDGRKVMFTGDNTWKKANPEQTRNGPIVPHNVYFLDRGFITCAEEMLKYAPDMVCPAHTEEYYPTRDDLGEFLGWAFEIREVMTGLIDQPDPNFGMDYRWCRFYPYMSSPEVGDEFTVDVQIRNHLFKDAPLKVELKLPGCVTCDNPVREIVVKGKKQVSIPFTLKKVSETIGTRDVITADITIDGRHIGEYAEALIQ